MTRNKNDILQGTLGLLVLKALAAQGSMHGYAITGHSAQGLTCDRAFVLVTSEASREWCYTALSRGREANRIYAVS